MPMDDQKDQEQKVLELVREAVKYDEELRAQYQIGDKFRFVRDRLQDLLTQLEQHYEQRRIVKKDDAFQLSEDEIIVYVYLYNAHGVNLKSWENMVTPKVFYEYSVNRPIYAEQKEVEILLRSKSDKLQHAYLAIAVKQKDILTNLSLKDGSGNALLKVKEGALRFERVMSFTHNQHDYFINAEGGLIKKGEK